MTLDRFEPTSPIAAPSREARHDGSAAELFAQSALYELRQSAFGLAQTVGLQDRVPEMEQPMDAESWASRQLQMLGRGFGSFVPSAGAALVSRYGVGKVLEHLPGTQVADNFLLKRSVIGLSATESVATGVLTGALFKPTDGAKVDDWKSFLVDRTESAVSSGIAFGVTAVGTFGWSKLAKSAPLSELSVSGFLKSAPVVGAVSGIFGGIANVESSSLITDGKLNFDGKVLAQSVYEMSVTGGLFGAGSSVFSKAARDAIMIPSAEQVPITSKGSSLPFPNVPTLDDFIATSSSVPKSGAMDGLNLSGSVLGIGIASEHSPLEIYDSNKSEPVILLEKSSPFGTEFAFEKESSSSFEKRFETALSEVSPANKLVSPDIERLFGAESRATTILKQLSDLPEITKFIKKSPESRVDLINKLVDHDLHSGSNGDVFSRLNVVHLEDLAVAQKIYGLNSKTFDQILEIEKRRRVTDLVQRAAIQPESVKETLQNLHDLGVKDVHFTPHNLTTIGVLADALVKDRPLFDRLKSQSVTGSDLSSVAHFIQEYGASIDEFKTLSDLGAKPTDFPGLGLLNTMLDAVGEEPELLTGFLNLRDTQGVSLSTLNWMLAPDSLARMLATRNSLRQAISFTGTAGEPSLDALMQSYVTPEYFENNMPLGQAINSASSDWHGPKAVFILAKFVEEDPVRRASFAAQLVKSVGEGVTVTPEFLRGSERLFRRFEEGSSVFTQLARNFAPQLGSISDFIDKDPDVNMKLVVDELQRNGHDHDALRSERLDALAELNKTYGANTTVVRFLRGIESDRVSLSDLNEFVQQSPEKKAFITTLSDMNAVRLHLTADGLDKAFQLRKELGENSPGFNRIMTNAMTAVSDRTLAFVKGDFETDPDAATNQLDARRSLLDKVARASTLPAHLDGMRLQGLLETHRKFGDDPHTLRNILGGEREEFDYLHNVNVLSKTEFGEAFIRHAFKSELMWMPDATELGALNNLANALKAGPELAMPLAKLYASGLNTIELAYYLNDDPNRIITVKKMIEDGASVRELSGERLQAIETVGEKLHDSPDLLAHLLDIEKSGKMDLNDVISFLDSGKPDRLEILRDLQSANGSPENYTYGNLIARSFVKELFVDKPDVLQKLLAKTSEGLTLEPLIDFAATLGNPIAKTYFENLINEDAPVSRFRSDDLVARAQFADHFGLDSQFMPQLMELSEKGLDVAEFTKSVAFREDLISAVQAMLERGAVLEDFEFPRLINIASLYNSVGLDPALMDRLDELMKQGLDDHEVRSFVSLKPEHAERLREYVQDGFSVRELSLDNLTDLDLLHSVSSKLDPSLNAVKYLQNLQRDGLHGAQLAQYVKERPDQRTSLIETLIKEKADASIFKDLMRLSVFPEDIAHTLVTKSRSGGMLVSELLHNLNSWECGAAFERLVTARAVKKESLDLDDLRTLAEQAKKNPDIGSEDLIPLSNDGFKLPSESLRDAALTLKLTADRIDSIIPKDKPIVLLGRDAWPLVPILKERGHDVQYFLWSRINERDEASYRQWMKEVKPGAVVVDTGFSGSIIGWIRERDNTASGLLMSSASDSEYGQILSVPDHRYRVRQLEGLAKLINRSRSFTEIGGALVAKEGSVDGVVALKYRQFSGVNRWQAQSDMRDMLRSAGLPEWYVWRYGNYVGLRPEDRIGLDSRSRVEEHYKQVEAARKSASNMAAEKP